MRLEELRVRSMEELDKLEQTLESERERAKADSEQWLLK
jgi:hypothetical protein